MSRKLVKRFAPIAGVIAAIGVFGFLFEQLSRWDMNNSALANLRAHGLIKKDDRLRLVWAANPGLTGDARIFKLLNASWPEFKESTEDHTRLLSPDDFPGFVSALEKKKFSPSEVVEAREFVFDERRVRVFWVRCKSGESWIWYVREGI